MRNQKGAITPLLVLGLLIAGIFIASKLIDNPQIFRSQASQESLDNTIYRVHGDGAKTLKEMKEELVAARFAGAGDRTRDYLESMSPYQIFKAYQQAGGDSSGRNLNCTYNIGDLQNMSSDLQQPEVGKEVVLSITQKWEQSHVNCNVWSINPKIFLNEIRTENIWWDDYVNDNCRTERTTDDKGQPFDRTVCDPGRINSGRCIAKYDIPQGQPFWDSGAGIYDQMDPRHRGRANDPFPNYGNYESVVRSCAFTPDQPGLYIVEAHFTHGACNANNRGDLVQTCRINVVPQGRTPSSTPTPQPQEEQEVPSPTPLPTTEPQSVSPTPLICSDDCFSDDLRTNVGVNPTTGSCDSGYSSVSHLCDNSNSPTNTQVCKGVTYRCIQSGSSRFWSAQ